MATVFGIQGDTTIGITHPTHFEIMTFCDIFGFEPS